MSEKSPGRHGDAGGTIYLGVAHFARKELFTRGLRDGFVSVEAVEELIRTHHLGPDMVHALRESLRMMGIEIRAVGRTG